MAEMCANRTHPRRSSRLATALKAAGPTRAPAISTKDYKRSDQGMLGEVVMNYLIVMLSFSQHL